MKTQRRCIGLCKILLALGAATVIAAETDVEVREDVRVPMRDGVELSTNVFLPTAEGKFPAIVVRTPYGKGDANNDMARRLASRGYAYVGQDCRGTRVSAGQWEPGVNEIHDGVDTHKWVLEQPWCNGKIGTAGGSYVGYTQWAVAPFSGQSLASMCTVVPLFDWHRDAAYIGGAFQLQTMMGWGALMARPARGQEPVVDLATWDWDKAYRRLPLARWDEQLGVEIPWMRRWVAHPTFDDYWAQMRIIDRLEQITAPNLTVSGWYDLFVKQALEHIPAIRKSARSETARRHQHLIVGPWGHGPNAIVGQREFGENAKIDFEEIQTRWFDHWLPGQDAGIDNWSPYRIFVMGRNEWRDEEQWPLARTQYTPYYLHSGGSANTLDGDGKLDTTKPADQPPDRYDYDPENPVPTVGGCLLFGAAGPRDQKGVESRDDVLVYTSDPTSGDVEVTGPIKVVLYASSSAPDTDWTAKLVDVFPDGHAYNLCDGVIRARYRESPDAPTLIEPEKIYRYEIDLWATSNVFLAGHRIRVEISSSNFPRFDRNPNTGHAFGADAELAIAKQNVYHDREHPSHALLPIIPNLSD